MGAKERKGKRERESQKINYKGSEMENQREKGV